MISPGAGWIRVNGMMESEEVGWLGLTRRLEISPCRRWGIIVGKDEERAKIDVKGRTGTIAGMEGVGEDKFEGIKERIEGSKH